MRDRELVSYFAFPLVDGEGQVMGHLGLAHTRPLHASVQAEALIATLATRASAELAFERYEEERVAIERKMHATSAFAGKGLAGFMQKPFGFNDIQRVVSKALPPVWDETL